MHHVIETIIKNSPHLSWMGKNTIYLTLHGSKAFNTDVEGSDSDFKGVCIPPFENVASFHKKFEQAILKAPDPDAVIFDLRKFMTLAAGANPSIIEVLFTDPSDHFIVTPIGQKLIDNRDLFLSKRARYSFSGYALSQLRRIKLHRGYLLNPPKEQPTRKEMGLPEYTLIPQDQLSAAEAMIAKELEQYNLGFLEVSEAEKIALRETFVQMMAELKITKDDQWLASAKRIGLDDNFIHLMQLERAYKNKKTDWDNYQQWKKQRNPERAADEAKFGLDCKHAYHLVRLIRMCKEIMTTGKVIVKRPDREELLAIRQGAWTYEQVVEYAENMDKDLEDIYKTSILPKTPDINKIDKLCIALIEEQWKIKD